MASASGSKELSLCHLVPLDPPHPGVLLSDPWHGDRVPTAVLASHGRGLVLGLDASCAVGEVGSFRSAESPRATVMVGGPSWIQGGKVGAFPFTSLSL